MGQMLARNMVAARAHLGPAACREVRHDARHGRAAQVREVGLGVKTDVVPAEGRRRCKSSNPALQVGE